jgi:hypothetical protein
MTSKQGYLGSVLLQKGGQVDLRVQTNGAVQLRVRCAASADPITVELVPGEVDNFISLLQKARA